MGAGTVTIVDAAGSTSPTGFTKQFGATTEFTVRADATLIGGKYIECNPAAAPYIALSIDAAGNTESDHEILCLMRLYTDADNEVPGTVFLRATAWGAATRNYVNVFPRKGSAGSIQQVRLARALAGTTAVVTPFTFAWSTGVWYAFRARIQGTTFSAKVWQPASRLAPTGDEPAAWGGQGTVTDIQGNGYIAFGVEEQPGVLVDFLPLGWGTAGETAPVTPTQMVYADAVVEANSWTGAVTDIDEPGVPSDVDYVESPASPTTAQPIVLRASPAANPDTDLAHQVTVRAWKNTTSGSPTLTLTPVWRTGYVNSGSRGTIIKTGAAVTLTGIPTDIVLTLSEAEAANIPPGEYATGVFVELIPEQT